MTSSGGEWVAVPVPGQPDRWDFVPHEQPPSPDGSPGRWHVVGGSGTEVGQWQWFPTNPLPAPPPPLLFQSTGISSAGTSVPIATPKRSKKVPLAIAGAVVVLAAAAAGGALAFSGGDDGKHKEEITALVNYVTTVDKGEDVCTSHLTEDFVRTIFGDVATCEQDDDTDGDSGDATGALVSDIQLDDADATAIVTVQGGNTDGATGTWAFRRGDDDVWRVSEWRADYLRSSLEKTFGETYDSDGPDDPFDNPNVRSCVKDRLLGQDDPAFLDTAYQLFRNSQESSAKLLGFMAECPSDTQGVSALRALFEKGFRASVQVPEQITECIVLGMRTGLSDEEIKQLSLNRGMPAPPHIQARIQQITLTCAGSPTSFDPVPEGLTPGPDLGV